MNKVCPATNVTSRLRVTGKPLFYLLLLLTTGPSFADTTWSGTNGDFANSANWTSGVPTSAITADINGGIPVITVTSNQAANQLIITSATGSGVTLNISPTFSLELAGSSSPALSIDGTSALHLTGGGALKIDAGGVTNNGTLNLDSGGNLQVGETNGINGTGTVAFDTGTLTVSGTALTTSTAISLTTGHYGNIDTNGLSATLSGNITGAGGGLNKIGSGNLNLTGTNNQIGSFFVLGGTLTQSSTASSLSSSEIGVGSGAGSTATYNMTGGTLTMLAGTPPAIVGGASSSFRVGDFGGTGTFNQSGGTVTVNGSLNVGNQGGQGTYALSGGSLILASQQSTLGRTSGTNSLYGGSTGELDVSGGTLSINGTAQLVLSNWYPNANQVQGTGVLNQTGGAVVVANTASLTLTGFGTGTYNLRGGILDIGGSSLQGVFGGENGSYVFNMEGGALQVYGSDLNTDIDLTLSSVNPATYNANSYSVIDTNGHNANFSGNVVAGTAGAGLFITDSLTGTGTVTFSGTGATTRAIASMLVSNGKVNQTNGTTTSAELAVGTGAGATGSYSISGTSVLNLTQGSTTFTGTSSSFRVGDFGGTGTFTQTGGTVNIGATAGVAGGFNIGNNGGDGTYAISGGTLNLEKGTFVLGRTDVGYASSSGELDLSGTGVINLDGGQFIIGDNLNTTNHGSGVINQTGGTFNVANGASLSIAGTGTGAYNLLGGVLKIGGTSLHGNYNTYTGGYTFNMGGGTLQVNGSNLTSSITITLSTADPTHYSFPGSYSIIDTNGFNANLSGAVVAGTAGAGLIVTDTSTGTAGPGTVTFSGTADRYIASLLISNGKVSQTGGTMDTPEIAVGTGTGATGTYTLSSGNLNVTQLADPFTGSAASFRVGDYGGTGTFNQTGGIVTVGVSDHSIDAGLNIGNEGGNGTYNLSAGTLDIEGGRIAMGRTTGTHAASTGLLNISGTGLLELNGTSSLINSDWYATPSFAEGSGTITQTGGTFAVANTARLYLTGAGQGIYNLNGGQLQIGGSSLVGVYGGQGGTYQFNLGGGTIQVTGTALTTSVNATLTSSTTSTINTNGLGATFTGTFSGSGNLYKTGAGDLTLTGASTNSGTTTIHQGALVAKNTTGSATGSGNLIIQNSATLRGTGIIAPASGNGVTIDDGGNLAPGLAPVTPGIANGHLTFTGTSGAVLTLAQPVSHPGTAQLTFDLGGGGTSSHGLLTLAGSSTYINLTNDYANEVVFNDNVILLNDLTGGGLAEGNYLLFAGGLNSDYQNLAIDGDGKIVSGITLDNSFVDYGISTLYLQDGNIYLQIQTPAVPEPGTWALLTGGLAFLALVSLRRRPAQ